MYILNHINPISMATPDFFYYVVRTTGPDNRTKRSKVLFKSSDLDDTVMELSKLHNNAKFIEDVDTQTFIQGGYLDLEPGYYLTLDEVNDFISVFKIKEHRSEGWLYNSEYKTVKLKSKYELII